MLNDTSSILSLLQTRRSGKPRELVGPGPSETELEQMLTIAARTPASPADTGARRSPICCRHIA